MPFENMQDILPFVQKPSQYLGSEVNRVAKDPDSVKLKMALAFPDLYDIGTSHFGIQILYHQLNQHDDILAERVYAPARDMEAELRHHHLTLPSIESKRSLDQFDIIGFSLLYELNFTNVLNMLDLGNIPISWRDRDQNHPFIIAGGPSVCNPEPMADFFDAMVFGDGEEVIMQMAQAWIDWNDSAQTKDKEALLKKWSQLEGVYVPRFFKAGYDEEGFQHLASPEKGNHLISRCIIPDLDTACFPDKPIIPFGKPIHDRLRIEISRGCTRGCRFCQAGMIYRPVRERSPNTILSLVDKSLAKTGYEDLSLLSLSTGDYACLSPLMENLMQRCQTDKVAVSLPSIRAGSLTPKLMDLIRSVRKTGFTIAPEAGSQRLRDVINKNITYDDVEATVKNAFELGWNVIKLYFMIGLPTETEQDLDAIVEMVKKLKQIKGPKRRKGKINVSITTFVPKAHTPFQWASQISLEVSKRKIGYLKQKLQVPGVSVKWQKPEMSILEGLLARGDRRMGALIEKAWKNGARFDGWNDQFNFDFWLSAIEQSGLDKDFFTTRCRNVNEPLPWQHMDAKVNTTFLTDQWQAALKMENVGDCRNGDCHACGVCDFSLIEPKIFNSMSEPDAQSQAVKYHDRDHEEYVWLSLRYTKLGDARFFGHIELSNIFSRALRRADIKVQFSKGFHPMPKISFDDPLPLGIESEGEYMHLLVLTGVGCTEIVNGLNYHLPVGVKIMDCQLRSAAKKEKTQLVQQFNIRLKSGHFDNDILDNFNRCTSWPYIRTNNKGREHNIDLKIALLKMTVKDNHTLIYDIDPQCKYTIRPKDILVGIFDMPADLLGGAKVMKLSLFSEEKHS